MAKRRTIYHDIMCFLYDINGNLCVPSPLYIKSNIKLLFMCKINNLCVKLMSSSVYVMVIMNFHTFFSMRYICPKHEYQDLLQNQHQLQEISLVLIVIASNPSGFNLEKTCLIGVKALPSADRPSMLPLGKVLRGSTERFDARGHYTFIYHAS